MRKKVSYTVAEETRDKFNEICDKESINKSDWLEKRMLEFIKAKEVNRNESE